MAAIQTETRAAKRDPRPHRLRGEILSVLLSALAVLVLLCLASYDPNDNSLMTAGGNTDRTNLIGAVGANISAALLQAFGIVSYALPLVLIFAAWRRFRAGRARFFLFGRTAGILLILLAVAALLALSPLPSFADHSYEPGGVTGAILTHTLAGWLNPVGASILLIAVFCSGVLLATDFSFTRLPAFVTSNVTGQNFSVSALTRFRAWRERRQAVAQERAERRRLAQAEAQGTAGKPNAKKRSAERVAEFMRATEPLAQEDADAGSSAAHAIRRAAQADADQPATMMSKLDAPALDRDVQIPATMHPSPAVVCSSPSVTPSLPNADAEVEEMVRSASVVRTEVDDAQPAEVIAPAQKSSATVPKAASIAPYVLPDLEFLQAPTPRHEQAEQELRDLATRVAEKCREFNVTGKIEFICPGPVVTTYEFKPDPGVKYARVTGLVDDLCLALKAESIRIDRVPGKAHVGIEVPNPERETIAMREVLASRSYADSESPLTLALGKTIDGLNYVADLAKMPHLLIAGATGTGKSVCLNSLIISILYKARPDEVEFIMIDPKRLELGLYENIPHLKHPIITEPKRAANALRWAVREMEERYKNLAKWSVRNLDGYNTEVRRRNLEEEYDDAGNPWRPLPYLVIIIDELADLMMVSGHDVEEAITRLAQMARAVGIHLVLATQRPSVDVITGLIKANFPSRISFRVSSKVDSRTILDANGAEGLLGRGDMLFLPPGTSRLVRVHGAFLDETEVARVVAHAKAQGQPIYDETITQSEEETSSEGGASGEHDELFDQALRICVEMKRASTSVLQRRLRIGYGRAAGILDAMEKDGLIGPADGSRPRPVLGRAYETVSHWDDVSETNPDV